MSQSKRKHDLMMELISNVNIICETTSFYTNFSLYDNKLNCTQFFNVDEESNTKYTKLCTCKF